MKKIILALSILAGSCQISFGQSVGNVIFECEMGNEENVQDKSLNCSNSSQLYQTYYNRYDFYRNSYNIRPTVTIPININVWQKDDGTENWQDIEEHKNRLKQIIDWVNAFYEDVELPSDPVPGVIELHNSKIQFELNEIYFYQNSIMWQTNSANNLHNSMVAVDPLRAKQLNIHITGFDSGSSVQGHARFPEYAKSITHYVVTYHNEAEPADIGNDWGFAKHLAHELGHDLDLRHTYDSNVCDQTDPYYLDDIFGVGAGVVCPHIGSWGCDAYAAGSNCTNNMMGGTPASRYLSPKQIYRTQLALSLKSIWRYVECEDYGQLPPIEIATDQLWDFEIRLYNPILVKNGATLTIACKVFMNMGHTITVEPGAKLVIDGGIITTECNDFWGGIVVQGDHTKAQLPEYQGMVVLQNGAIIEHAKEAIRLWNPGDYASTGGILVAGSNSTFRNNWRSAEFIYYHSYPSSGKKKEIKNKSSFTNCTFTWDDNYKGTTLAPAITMYHVNGAIVQGCDFIDNRTITASNIAHKSVGIHTIDASFVVRGTSLNNDLSNPTNHDWYAETDYDIGTFQNLYQGILATNANTNAQVTVDHCRFNNTEIGIELDASDNALITRNKFDNNNVAAQVVFRNSTSYTVEGNLMNGTGSNHLITGTYIENSGTEPNLVYRNDYKNVFLGNYAQGRNANDGILLSFTSGLQWQCNLNTGGIQDFKVRNFFPGSESDLGVRLFQGQLGNSAGNTFSPSIAPGGLGNDYHITTNDGQTMNYYAYQNDPIQIPTELEGSIIVNQIGNKNDCPSSFKKIDPKGEHPGKLSGIGKGGIDTELKTVLDDIQARNKALHDLMMEGNRNELHVLISTLNKTNRVAIKAALQKESPYLSEELLRELGNKSSTLFPHEWYKDLVIKNMEVAQNKNFLGFLKNKPEAMPEGLYNEILNKKDKVFTARGLKEIEILELNTRKEELLNVLLNHQSAQDADMDWDEHLILLNSRNHTLLKTELLDFYLSQNNQAEVINLLNIMEAETPNIQSAWNRVSMQDFVLFKRYLISIMGSNGALNTLSETDIANLEYMATSFTGKSARQARNILCFFAGRCEPVNIEIDLPSKGNAPQYKSLSAVPDGRQEFTESKTTNGLLIVPNPNSGKFEIKLPENCVLQEIILTDATGKQVEFEIESNQMDKTNVQVKANKKGIYLLAVKCGDGSKHNARMLLLE